MENKRRHVKVFILLGQSNMLGMGTVNGNDKDGTLECAVKTKGRFPWLFDHTTNDWKNPIFDSHCGHNIRYVFSMGSGNGDQGGKIMHNEWMTVKTCSTIGPEFGIAYELDRVNSKKQTTSGSTTASISLEHNQNDNVLILKSCIGNRSLGWDLLPPGSPGFLYEDPKTKTVWRYAGYKETPARWEDGTKPNHDSAWYAGCQYDGDVFRAKSILRDISTYVPSSTRTKDDNNRDDNDTAVTDYVSVIHNSADDDVSYEISGFFFWQGDKDRYDDAYASRYKENLVRLIRQLRHDFDAPNAKFVLATLGQTSWQDANGSHNGPNDKNQKKKTSFNDSYIFKAQMEVSQLPEFKDNCASVYSHPYSHGGASNSHYDGNAETYMDIGQAMGRCMADLIINQDRDAALAIKSKNDVLAVSGIDHGSSIVDDGWVLVGKFGTKLTVNL